MEQILQADYERLDNRIFALNMQVEALCKRGLPYAEWSTAIQPLAEARGQTYKEREAAYVAWDAVRRQLGKGGPEVAADRERYLHKRLLLLLNSESNARMEEWVHIRRCATGDAVDATMVGARRKHVQVLNELDETMAKWQEVRRQISHL